MPETNEYPAWGYAPGRAAIFDEGPLPAGWSSDPAAFGEDVTAEAVSAVAERNPGPVEPPKSGKAKK